MLRKTIVALLPLVLILACCAPYNPSGKSGELTASPKMDVGLSLTDGLGRTVILPHPAQTVVSLAPANTEILFAIGAAKQVVGRDSFSDYPEAAKSIQDIGGSMGKYNTEAIVSLHPDLVLAGGINPPELISSLEKLGLKVYFLPNPARMEDMFTYLDTVGQLTGHTVQASDLVRSLKSRLESLDKKLLLLNSKPTVYYELDASDPNKPYTGGPGSFVDMFIQRAGGNNIGKALQGEWAQISLEELIVQNPSIIILGDSAYGETPAKLAARAGWDVLDAVKNHQVFPFDDNLISRPGPRWVDGLEALAKLLHPNLFK